MILADKIIELRKKNGWSQEELAEKLEVSRQAVSKWESAQSVPDMNRIIMLSKVFGVSTDYLLKDELGEDPQRGQNPPEDSDAPLRRVTMDEAQVSLRYRRRISNLIPLGVLMCILSPIALILMAVGQESGVVRLSEAQAVGFGLLAMFVLIGGAVALFVLSGLAGKPFEYLSKECFETEYGVAGFVRERQDRERSAFIGRIVGGVVLCVCSAIPIFAAMLLGGDKNEANEEFIYAVAVAALLCVVAFDGWLMGGASIRRGGYSALLEEGDYSRANKLDQARNNTLSGVYWGLVTAGYLAWSFISNDWHRTWIVWPVAGVLYGVVLAVAAAVRNNK